MRKVKIELIGWILVSIFLLTILGLSFWNAWNHWNIKTDGMNFAEQRNQETITGLSMGLVAVIGVVTGLVLIMGLYGKIEDAYTTES